MATLTQADIDYMLAHTSEDRRPNYIAANAICLGFAITAVALRFVSRTMAAVKIGIDDYTIGIALLFTIIYVASLFVTVHYGMGRHVVPYLTDAKPFAQWALVAETFYNASIMMTKLSILGLFHRIFPLKWFKRAILFLAFFIVAYSITQMFGTIFQCVPIRSKWTPDITPKCINYVAMIIGFGVVNILTDFIMLAFPIPALWSLQISSHRKWALSFMFLIGGFVCIISIVRLFYARHVDTVDATWDFVWPSFISGLECCSAIVAACIPTYRPLVNKIRHGVAAENTVPRPTKPSTNPSKGSTGLHIPLRRFPRGKSSNLSATSTDSHEMPLYSANGGGNDFEARVETSGDANWAPGREPAKQEILVTHSFTTQ